MHICDRNLNRIRPCDFHVTSNTSNQMAFGIADLDDLSVHRMLQARISHVGSRIDLMRSTRSTTMIVYCKDDMTYIHIYPYIYLCHMSYVYIYICAYMLYLHVLIPFDYTQLLRVDDVMMKTSILEPENWSRPRLRYRSAISWWWRWSKMTKWQSLTKWQKYTNSCGFERFGTNEWCVRTVFFCLPEFWQYFPFYKTPRYTKLSSHLQSCNCCNYPKLWNRMPLVLALLALRLVVFHCDRLSFRFRFGVFDFFTLFESPDEIQPAEVRAKGAHRPREAPVREFAS